MQNYQELMRDIEARMQTLGPRDVCALFLLSVESREAGRALDMTESAERAASLLSRFFRITDIVGYEKIVEDARTVLKTLAPIDREVVATNGQYYTLRIAPYRTTENSIKGQFITIIDSLETDRAKKQ